MSVALLLIILVPAVGAIVCAMLPRTGSLSRHFALAVSLLTLLLGICLAAQFWGKQHHGEIPLQFGTSAKNPFYMENIGFGLRLGADAISIWLVLLTVLLQPLAILASFQSITERRRNITRGCWRCWRR
jgi:NADH-quinone oxidoreductase subunit M